MKFRVRFVDEHGRRLERVVEAPSGFDAIARIAIVVLYASAMRLP